MAATIVNITVDTHLMIYSGDADWKLHVVLTLQTSFKIDFFLSRGFGCDTNTKKVPLTCSIPGAK